MRQLYNRSGTLVARILSSGLFGSTFWLLWLYTSAAQNDINWEIIIEIIFIDKTFHSEFYDEFASLLQRIRRYVRCNFSIIVGWLKQDL